jgi:hypothetical protein
MMDVREVCMAWEVPEATLLPEGQRHSPVFFSVTGVSTRDASQPAKEIQDDSVEFLRLLHVRHVMGLGNRHSPGTDDSTFDFSASLKSRGSSSAPSMISVGT